MPPNPFIELARDPVATLAWLAYGLFLVGIVLAAVPWAIRKAATLVVQYHANKHGGKWWSFGDSSAGYIPPTGWLAQLFGIIFVLATASLALATVFWIIL